MTRQFKRTCEVTVGSALTASYDETEATGTGTPCTRIRFHVQHWEAQTPAWTEINLYNLSKESERKCLKVKQYEKVSLKAGYAGDNQLIFKGEVIQVRVWKENPVDSVVTILGRSMQQAYNHATVSETLDKGSTFKQQFDVCMKAMKAFGVEQGFVADLGSKRMPKNRVMHGMAPDLLRRIGFATNTTPFFDKGKLHMVKVDGFRPGDAIVLNSDTGLIGRVEQTLNGIVATCLLNPRIEVATKLKIDESSINRAAFGPSYQDDANQAFLNSNIAADGIYKVLFVDEDGDTRGGPGSPWYTKATCVAASGGLIGPGVVRAITDPSAVSGSSASSGSGGQ